MSVLFAHLVFVIGTFAAGVALGWKIKPTYEKKYAERDS